MARRRQATWAPPESTRWSQDEARAALAAWQQSGLSAGAFARIHGLAAQRLCWWRKRLGAWSAPARPAAVVSLVPVEVVAADEDAGGGARLIVRLAVAGAVVEIADAAPSWAAALIRELARSS